MTTQAQLDWCPHCNGTGWVLAPDDDTRNVRCICWRERQRRTQIASLQIPDRYRHCDLDRFELYENEGLTMALAAARKFAATYPVERKGLFFIGQPGIGKTHLAAALLKHVALTVGATGLFVDVRDFLKAIRDTYNPTTMTTESDVLRPAMTVDVLVLDDMGAEKTSLWVEETLNLVVNARYSENRATIFTSNYEVTDDLTDPDNLRIRVGYRMFSRLLEMCTFVEYDGADYRDRPEDHDAKDLENLWQRQRAARQRLRRAIDPLFGGSGGDGKADLKWPGGRGGNS